MKYISLAVWRDLTDRHLYAVGDPFPYDGREISPARLSRLESGQNEAGFALIRAVEEPDDKPVDRKTEAPERAKTGRKTATRKTAKGAGTGK